jgi:hypothetical protein
MRVLLALCATKAYAALARAARVSIIAVPATLSASEFGIVGGATESATGIKHALNPIHWHLISSSTIRASA